MLIGLYRDSLNVYPRGRSILVVEGFLRLDETAGLFGDDASVSVPRLVQMDRLEAGGCCILLQVIDKGS